MNLKQLSGLDFVNVAVKSIADKMRNEGFEKNITFTELRSRLTKNEYQIVDWLLSLKPSDVGVGTPFCGLDEPKSDTELKITTRTHKVKKDDGSIKTYQDRSYTPVHIWSAWLSLNKALVSSGQEGLSLVSTYRSPAYQAALLCYRLSHNLETPLSVFKLMALPGYSQHGLITNTAIDIDTQEEFSESPRYDWLIENADKYGFYLSYPEGNQDGIIFEPWHWQWLGENKSN